ncbi:unnamed protein product [Bursaphelenchus xylophilus]|nr:unnamed protein product [Bursaphelenchus xylophilus]CAG9097393.1 unnamed protein product [Bursaphelenchus xylophilus]
MRLSLLLLAVFLVSAVAAKKPKTIKERAKRDVSKVAKAVEDKSKEIQQKLQPDEPEDELAEHKPYEELVHQEDEVNGHQRRIVKPKSLKVLSAYEQCKLECKRQRDQENAQEYVERLRDELKQAEELIANQKTQEAENI